MTTDRVENTVQVGILLLVGAMAGAAAFTHVHDWTMNNTPEGTGDWFGWANAVISELMPLAAGLEIRRRKRAEQSIGYPAALLIIAVAFSLTAQVAEAKPTPTGWLLAALPALAFLALSKLVISRTHPQRKQENSCADAPIPTVTPVPSADAPTRIAKPAQPGAATANGPTNATAAPTFASNRTVEITPQLLTGARIADYTHRQSHGQPITIDALTEHLGIDQLTGKALLRALNDNDTSTSVMHPNGTVQYGGGRA